MEENDVKDPGTGLSGDQIEQVAGGGDCDATVTISSNQIGVVVNAPDLGSALIQTYDGVVDATSHVIETVATSLK